MNKLCPFLNHLGKAGSCLNAASLLACGAIFRFWCLGNIPGLSGDEAWSAVTAQLLIHGRFIRMITPSLHPIDWLYLLPVYFDGRIFQPSVPALRAVAVVFGLLALPVNFLLIRRIFGQLSAVISTVLLTISPMAIAYSRIGWEVSQSPIIDLCVLYAALNIVRKPTQRSSWIAKACLTLAAAVIVQPTNILMGTWIGVAIFLTRKQPYNLSALMTSSSRSKWIVFSAALAILAISLAAKYSGIWNGWGINFGIGDPITFMIGWLNTFNGIAAYQDFVGSGGINGHIWGSFSIGMLMCLVSLVIWVWTAVVLIRKTDDSETFVDKCLVYGLVLSTILFGLTAGPQALSSGYERYALWLTVPCVLTVTRALIRSGVLATRSSIVSGAVTLLLPWSVLAGFYFSYFYTIVQTGGSAHPTYRTGHHEPKVAALDYILTHRTNGEPVEIYAPEYWNYESMSYLTTRYTDVKVTNNSSIKPSTVSIDRWYVRFAVEPGTINLADRCLFPARSCTEYAITDFAGKPILILVHLQGRTSGANTHYHNI